MALILNTDMSTMKGWVLQAKDPSRSTFLPGVGRKLTTMPGDENIAGSGLMRRCDYYKVDAAGNRELYKNVTQWWRHWLMFPDDFQRNQWEPYNVFDFHHYPEPKGSANFALRFGFPERDDQLGRFHMQWVSGTLAKPVERHVFLPEIERNKWYTFVYEVRWSSGSTGFFNAWLNDKLVSAHDGPTLYSGGSVYPKLANYHLPTPLDQQQAFGFPPTPASSVIHGGILMGTSLASVSP